jgi:hypothetical protein
MKSIVTLVMTFSWILGIVFAKGVLSTVCAFLFPFWAWILVVEHYLIYLG